MVKRTGTLPALLCSLIFLMGCGSNLPFDYRYTSANTVVIDYKGGTYLLNRFGPKTPGPFDYEFESDGDLDISIGGQTYEIDSPYDVDRSKKKKKTKPRKKKTTRK